MYFHLMPHVYATSYNEEIILLDLIKDQYIILQDESAQSLIVALTSCFKQTEYEYTPAEKIELLPEQFQEKVKDFLAENIIEISTKPYKPPQSLICKKITSGASNIDWRIEAGNLDKKVNTKMVLEAYWELTKVKFILRWYGFYKLIKYLEKKVKKARKTFIPKSQDLNQLITAVNKACYYFPSSTVCLPWSSVVVVMALRRKWQSQLVIGIQNYPFAAHAWVEIEGNVVADNSDLPKDLAVILKTKLTHL